MDNKYYFDDLLESYRDKDLPEDVNDYVLEKISGLFKLFPEVEKPVREMFEKERKLKSFTGPGKTFATFLHPVKKIPLLVMEWHYGVCKQFAWVQFYGDSAFFPRNTKNRGVIFGGKRK